jgi:hypothetical protein
VSESRNLTFDASPSFTVTIAATSPLDLSTPNIVMITLKTSSPFPVSAFAVAIVDTIANVRINARKNVNEGNLFSMGFK